jgi:hypothetical protein
MRMPRLTFWRATSTLKHDQLLIAVLLGAGLIVFTVFLPPYSRWVARCGKEALRCDVEARYWDHVAEETIVGQRIFSDMLVVAPPSEVDYNRRQVAELRFLGDRARMIAGLYRQWAVRWRSWRPPEVQPDLRREFWIAPEESELARYFSP